MAKINNCKPANSRRQSSILRINPFRTRGKMPVSRQTKIYRYLSLEKFLDLLDRQSLYMALISQFSDRWELSPPKILETKDFWISRLQKSARLAAYKSFHECWAETIISRFAGDYFSGIENFRASCWTTTGPYNAALWAIYSNRQSGIVVGTTIQAIFDSTSRSRAWESGLCIAPVTYVDYSSTIDPMSQNVGFTHDQEINDFQLSQIGFMYKNKSLSFENEIRILTYMGQERLQLNSFEFIDEIVLGPDTSDTLFRLVSKMCLEASLQALVRISSLKAPEAKREKPVDYTLRKASVDEHKADRVVLFNNSNEFFLWYKNISTSSGIPRLSQKQFGIPTYTEESTLFHYGFVCSALTGVFGALSASVFAEGFISVEYNINNGEWQYIDPVEFSQHLSDGLHPLKPPPAASMPFP